MCDLAALLQLLADAQKTMGFFQGPLHSSVFALGGGKSVITLHDSYHKSARSDFSAGFGRYFKGRASTVFRDVRQGDIFIHVALADVFMYSIICDIATARCTVSLCVVESCVVVDVGQQRGATLY